MLLAQPDESSNTRKLTKANSDWRRQANEYRQRLFDCSGHMGAENGTNNRRSCEFAGVRHPQTNILARVIVTQLRGGGGPSLSLLGSHCKSARLHLTGRTSDALHRDR